MPTPRLLTHEIGSLAKPSWRVKAFSSSPLTDKDIAEAESWGKKLDIPNYQQLTKLLGKKSGFTKEEKEIIMDFSCQYAIRLLEKAGLDLVWDGEQQRVEMYEYPLRRTEGFEFRGHVRSFDNKYYCKASCTHTPAIQKPFHVDEFKKIEKHAKNKVKIPVTGAYTIVDWSFDEHYLAGIVPGKAGIHEERKKARTEFLKDTAKNVIHPNIKALYDAGARYIQIDEPAATTKRDEIPEFIESMKYSIGTLAGKAFFSVHICFSDYARLFPEILKLEGILDEVHFEYANRDSHELGRTAEARTGYEILHQLKNTPFKIGLGVLDVHTDKIESPELVRDRILYALDIIQDPSRLYISPDCGLRTRTWDVSFDKLKNMVEGRDLALREIGL